MIAMLTDDYFLLEIEMESDDYCLNWDAIYC